MPEQDIKRRASELLQKGRLSEAIQEYKALLEQSKRPNPAIINLIGDIYIKQGDHPAGFSHFLKACKHYANEGLYHNGIAVGKKILRLDKDQTEVYGTLGDLYARQGLGMDAVKFLNEFARRKEEASEFPAALAAFAQACETLTDCPELNIAYGEMLERVDRAEEAAANFRRAADIYADRNMNARAEHWLNRARSVSGEAEDPSGDTGVWDMMSLRPLDEKDGDAPTERPPAAAERPHRPGSGIHVRSQWGVFDPDRNPAVPPPPPLPPSESRGEGSRAPTPIAAEDLASPAGVSSGLPSAEQAAWRDGTDLGPEPPGLSPPGGGTPPAADGVDLRIPPEAPPPLPVDDGPGPYGVKDSLAASLRNLPGIIMPPSTKRRTAAVPPPASPADLPPDPPETGETSAPADGAPAAPAAPEGRPPTREQAIIIGDDTELVREGGDVNEVINDFREATSQILGSEDHQAHYDLGTTYLEMELFEEAASEFAMAAGGARFALVSQEMLGYCFLRQGHIERAVEELRKGLALEHHEDAAKIGLYYNLGIACGVLGMEQDAIDAFRRVESLNPEFRDTKTRLQRLAPRGG